MANEDIKCTHCPKPAFFRIINLRDNRPDGSEVKEDLCREHFGSFMISGLNKLQQATFIEKIKQQTGFEFKVM